MRIKEIDGFTARCEARGIERKASLFLLQHENLQVGDLVMIHVGNAIQKMNEEEARSAWELYDEILEMEANEPVGGRSAGDRPRSPAEPGTTGMQQATVDDDG
jgi:hydrogenase expression/formation protein HypC